MLFSLKRFVAVTFLLMFQLVFFENQSLAGLTVKEQFKWKKNQVKVCWGSENNFAQTCKEVMPLMKSGDSFIDLTERKKVESCIRNAFKKEDVGIEFVGWDACPSNPTKSTADAMLFFTTSTDTGGTTGGMSDIGVCLNHKDPPKPSDIIRPNGFPHVSLVGPTKEFFDKNNLKYKGIIKISFDQERCLIAMHEFGHLAGLFHEDSQIKIADLPYDPTKALPTSAQSWASIMSYKFTYQFKRYGLSYTKDFPFDPFNVIELPRPHEDARVVKINMIGERHAQINLKIGLSTSDVHALRCLYMYSPEHRSSICNEYFKPWEIGI